MHEGVRNLRALVESFRPPGPLSLDDERASAENIPQVLPPDVTLTTVEADGVSGEWLAVDGETPTGTLLVIHGGGYRVGSARSHRGLAGALTRACGARTLSINYRLAPEHPCPAAIDDAVAAYRWLLAEGTPPESVVVVGDSAGGGLALALLLALRADGDPLPAGAVLLAPWVDLTLSGDSVESRREEDFLLTESSLREMADQYRGERQADDPLVSPLFADLTGLPPLLIQTGDHDLLRDDSIRLGERAAACGVAVETEIWPDMPHVFQVFFALLPEGQQGVERIGAWVRTRVASNAGI